MLRVFTNHHNLAFSLDDLALIADLLDGWFNLHCYYTIPFCFGVLYVPRGYAFVESPVRGRSFCSPGDASLVEVVNRNLNRNAVTGKNSDIVHTKLARNVSCNDVLIGELHLEGGIGQSLNNRSLKFNCVLRQNNPSVSLLDL